jgi:class 3 adenylate cyclase
MPLEDFESHDAPHKVMRTVLIADLVDSVRLMEEDEDETVQRWRQVVERVERDVLPAHGGRLVKSLGDGFLLEFSDPRSAVSAAFAVHRACEALNPGAPPGRQIGIAANEGEGRRPPRRLRAPSTRQHGS